MTTLDQVWEEINALGGSSEQNNSYDQGIVDTVAKALAIVERAQAVTAPADQCVAREALERQRCIAICEGWIGAYQDREIKFTSPREYALDAINDILDLIRDGHVPALAVPASRHQHQ